MKILFVCYANACRSQMAQAYARYRAPDDVEIESAGKIAAGLWPQAVEAMDAWDVPTAGQWSKTLSQVDVGSFDVVVTLADRVRRSADELAGPGARRVHWPIMDPASARGSEQRVRDTFALVREDIARAIDGLLEELVEPARLRPTPPGRRPEDPLGSGK